MWFSKFSKHTHNLNLFYPITCLIHIKNEYINTFMYISLRCISTPFLPFPHLSMTYIAAAEHDVRILSDYVGRKKVLFMALLGGAAGVFGNLLWKSDFCWWFLYPIPSMYGRYMLPTWMVEFYCKCREICHTWIVWVWFFGGCWKHRGDCWFDVEKNMHTVLPLSRWLFAFVAKRDGWCCDVVDMCVFILVAIFF